MKYFQTILISTICCFFPLSGIAQSLHTNSNRALKIYKEGVSSYDYLDFIKAENDFRSAISIDKTFYEAYIMLGELLEKQNRYSEAAVNYRSAVKLDSLFFKPVFFNLANAEMMSGSYADALIHFKVYEAQQGMSAKNKAVACKKH